MKRFLPKINGGEALIYVIIIIAVAMMITMLISAKTPNLKQNKKSYFFYVVIQAFLFLVFASLLYNLKEITISQRFVSFQIYFVIVGTLHLILFQTFFKKFQAKKMFTEIALAFVTALYLAGFMVVIASYFSEFNFLTYLFSTLLFFIIPTLTYTLFQTAISIPAKLHKRWFYPLNSIYPSPQTAEMRNVIILNLVFQKKIDDREFINFKVKAPRAFDFGRLFFYFINDYNEKNPNGKINYLDDNAQPFGWYFHTKPEWFGSSKYIDSDVAIDTNNIKDGTTIICQRI